MHEPRAYAYDAALHCPECAERAGMTGDDAIDSEGNFVGVVAPWDEAPEDGEHCDDCGEYITEPSLVISRIGELTLH